MLERSRLESKKISKTNAVTSQLDYDIGKGNCHIGPSDYVEWLSDRKWAYIRMEGTTFGNVPLNVEMKLEVWDSPNSAGVVIDAVRCCKLGLDNGLSGALVAPSAYFKKSPPVQFTDDEARIMTEEFIAEYGQQSKVHKTREDRVTVGTNGPRTRKLTLKKKPEPRKRSTTARKRTTTRRTARKKIARRTTAARA
jgi:myo-inositol-1-phosphate synthase